MTPTPPQAALSGGQDVTTDPHTTIHIYDGDGGVVIRENGNISTFGKQTPEVISAFEAASSAPTPPSAPGVRVRGLDWEDADEGMCTKWRAEALGGSYDLVEFDRKDGFAVNFSWGRPLSFWFIQGEPDDFGYPSGPKMFPTLEAAKAAAQADCERRILSTLEPSPQPIADGGRTRSDLAKGLAMLDGIPLQDIPSTVGNPTDANNWREYLGRADDLMAHLSAALNEGTGQ